MSTFQTRWELLLADKMSGPLRRIAAGNENLERALGRVNDKLNRLQSLSLEARLRRQFEGAGKSVDALNLRLERLTLLRDKAFDPARVKALNREMAKTQKELDRLQNIGKGGNFLTKAGGQLTTGLAAVGLSPQLAGAAALGTAAVSSFNKADEWDAMLGKINVTAQLSQSELAKLDTKLRQIGKNSNVDMAQIPAAFERIISATGDVDSALALLQPTLKASAANMADLETTAGAAVNVMNSVQGASPAQVFDVLTETMKAGNVQFKDLAQYLPKLLPFANQAGVSFTDAAGAFAFMTKMGLNAEASTTQLSAAFRALADPERVDALRQIGVNVFDAQGKMRKLVDVAGDLEKRLKGLSDKRKAEILASINLDSEAASGLSILAGNTGTLRQVVGQVENSQGALDRSVQDSDSGRQRRQRSMNVITEAQLAIGDALVPVLELLAKVAGDVLAPVLHGLAPALQVIGELLGQVALPIMEALNPIFEILGELLAAMAPILKVALLPALVSLRISLALLAVPLKILAWLMGLLAKALEWLKGILEPVINFFEQIAEAIRGFIQKVKTYVNDLLSYVGLDSEDTAVSTVAAAASKAKAKTPKQPEATKIRTLDQLAGSMGESTLPTSTGLSDGIRGVAAGGERPRNIYVNIGSLIDQMSVNMNTATDVSNLRRQISEVLTDALRDSENAAA